MKKYRNKESQDMTEYFQQEFVKEAANININLKPGEREKKDKPQGSPTQTSPEQIMSQTQNAPQQPQQEMQQAPQQQPQQQAMDPAMQQGQPMEAGQVDPMTGLPLNGPQPAVPTETNNLGQAAVQTTAIVCTSDCMYAQNPQGLCSLNKINIEQVKQGVFECVNYEPVPSEPQV